MWWPSLYEASKPFQRINYFILQLFVIVVLYCRKACGLDYCLGTSLYAKCPLNEVVIVQEAVYGRMRTGNCIPAGSNYTGCYGDVQRIADVKCSGRQSCEIRVSNNDMDAVMKCSTDFARYLSASYTCERVIGVDVVQCQSTKTLRTSFNSGYIASITSNSTGCGLKNSPYEVEALPGQTLSLSLLDFFYIETTSGQGGARRTATTASRRGGYIGSNKGWCREKYGYIQDLDTKDQLDICRGTQRETELLKSKGHRVRLVLDSTAVKKYAFMIKVKVIGCHDIIPPADAWLSREGDEIRVGCHSQRQTWQLRCEGNRWMGVIGNCTRGTSDKQNYSAVIGGKVTMSHGLSIVIIVTVSIVLCGTIILLGLLYLKRSQRHVSGGKLLMKQVSHGKEVYTYHHHHGNKLAERPDRNRYMHISEHAPPEALTGDVTAEESQDTRSYSHHQSTAIPDYCTNQLDGTTYMDEYLLNIQQSDQSVSVDMTKAQPDTESLPTSQGFNNNKNQMNHLFSKS